MVNIFNTSYSELGERTISSSFTTNSQWETIPRACESFANGFGKRFPKHLAIVSQSPWESIPEARRNRFPKPWGNRFSKPLVIVSQSPWESPICQLKLRFSNFPHSPWETISEAIGKRFPKALRYDSQRLGNRFPKPLGIVALEIDLPSPIDPCSYPMSICQIYPHSSRRT